MRHSSSIIVIEDQKEIQLSAKFLLRKNFNRVDVFDHPETAMQTLLENTPDVVLLDMNFSRGMHQGQEGLHWLKRIITLQPHAVVVLMTAYADVELAIRSIKNGAFDFIIKPWENQKFQQTIMNAYQYSLIRNKNIYPDIEEKKIIGNAVALREALRIADKVSVTDAGVLILGENGTGKDLIAERIHKHSLRKDKPFIKVDLGSITENLFESEMFGHVKGAFTDAKEEKTGWFEQANGGTLFLDEIGNLTLPLQAKLLSAIQTSTITKVGSTKKIELDTRVISATNAELHALSQKGEFRKDLLYRLNTVTIHLPSLRDRGRDVLDLAEHFLMHYSLKYKRSQIRLAQDTITAILNYDWPGNIRELQHSIERAVILCDGHEILPEDITVAKSGGTDPSNEHLMNLEEIEMNTIRKALTKHGGVITHAAHELGLTRASLYRRLEKYGL